MEKRLKLLFTTYNDGKSLQRMLMAVLLLAVSPFLRGISDNFFSMIAFLTGLFLLYYSILRPWQSLLYYGMMSLSALVLFLLWITFGIDILVKMYPHGKHAEDIGWTVGGVFIVAIVAGIFGIFRFFDKKQPA